MPPPPPSWRRDSPWPSHKVRPRLFETGQWPSRICALTWAFRALCLRVLKAELKQIEATCALAIKRPIQSHYAPMASPSRNQLAPFYPSPRPPASLPPSLSHPPSHSHPTFQATFWPPPRRNPRLVPTKPAGRPACLPIDRPVGILPTGLTRSWPLKPHELAHLNTAWP